MSDTKERLERWRGKGKPIGRDQARRVLADGVEACPYCSPDTALGMPG
ncbi:DUF6233 domain-containing protein [Streptomyces sp. NPDC051130]